MDTKDPYRTPYQVDTPKQNLETTAFFSGIVCLEDEEISANFLQLLVKLVDQSAHIFFSVREDESAASSLEQTLKKLRSELFHFDNIIEEEHTQLKRETKECIKKANESIDFLSPILLNHRGKDPWQDEQIPVMAGHIKTILEVIKYLIFCSKCKIQGNEFGTILPSFSRFYFP